ncbi:hypothetical protein HaLaN_19078 [Haematococcus lacustris]|uniref:Uncharacterized protein n=1 Tax=Haematococcus lacustris TaxID=44745 RepID=A0A699ZPY7_HAELA|nr:hypothetical protein HaLaN_19078 [Haematococcus lacustris]
MHGPHYDACTCTHASQNGLNGSCGGGCLGGHAYLAGREGMGVSVVSWRGRLKRGLPAAAATCVVVLPAAAAPGVAIQPHFVPRAVAATCACLPAAAAAAGPAAQPPAAPCVEFLPTGCPASVAVDVASAGCQQLAAPSAAGQPAADHLGQPGSRCHMWNEPVFSSKPPSRSRSQSIGKSAMHRPAGRCWMTKGDTLEQGSRPGSSGTRRVLGASHPANRWGWLHSSQAIASSSHKSAASSV